MATFLQRITPRGFLMQEIYSLLQKAHRRNDVDHLLRALLELDGFLGAIFNRLMIFVCEDGAFLDVALACMAAKPSAKEMKTKAPAAILRLKTYFLATAALPKAHSAAWLNRLLVEALVAADSQRPTLWTSVVRDFPVEAAIVLKYCSQVFGCVSQVNRAARCAGCVCGVWI